MGLLMELAPQASGPEPRLHVASLGPLSSPFLWVSLVASSSGSLLVYVQSLWVLVFLPLIPASLSPNLHQEGVIRI